MQLIIKEYFFKKSHKNKIKANINLILFTSVAATLPKIFFFSPPIAVNANVYMYIHFYLPRFYFFCLHLHPHRHYCSIHFSESFMNGMCGIFDYFVNWLVVGLFDWNGSMLAKTRISDYPNLAKNLYYRKNITSTRFHSFSKSKYL